MNTLVFLTLIFGAPHNTCSAAALCTEDRTQCEVTVAAGCEMTLAECLNADAVELDWTGQYGDSFYTVYGCANERAPKTLDAGKGE